MRIALLVIFTSVAAFGQSFEAAVSGGVSRLNNNQLGVLVSATDVANYSLQDGWRLGFRFTLNTWRYFGQEFGYGYNRTQLRNETTGTDFGMAIHQGFYDLVAYPVREGARVRPFLAGGAHFNNYIPPGSSVTSGGGATKIGFNYGGGLKVRVGQMFGIRFDVRQYQNGKPFDFLQGRKGLIGQLEVSVGFGLVI